VNELHEADRGRAGGRAGVPQLFEFELTACGAASLCEADQATKAAM